MSSWSCPHFDAVKEHCNRLDKPCVLGRPGCVLPRTLSFATPLADRIRAADEAAARRNASEHKPGGAPSR